MARGHTTAKRRASPGGANTQLVNIDTTPKTRRREHPRTTTSASCTGAQGSPLFGTYAVETSPNMRSRAFLVSSPTPITYSDVNAPMNKVFRPSRDGRIPEHSAMRAAEGPAHSADEVHPTAAICAAQSNVQSRALGRTAKRSPYA